MEGRAMKKPNRKAKSLNQFFECAITLRDLASKIDDPKIKNIDISSGKDEVIKGFKYASDQYSNHFKALKEADFQYQQAIQMGQKSLAAKKDREFNKAVGAASYYHNEADRLIKIWSEKTGHPCFLQNGAGVVAYLPKSREMVRMSENDISKVEKMLSVSGA